MPERQSVLKAWLPLILQSAVFLITGLGYATAAEHRMTVVEETLKSQAQLMQSIVMNQRELTIQLKELERIANTQIALEDYIHRVRGAQ